MKLIARIPNPATRRFAARYHNLEIVSALLKRGASVERVDHAGVGPLLIAAKHGYADVISALINNEANVKARDEYSLIPIPTHNAP